jgi:hypothetical protein
VGCTRVGGASRGHGGPDVRRLDDRLRVEEVQVTDGQSLVLRRREAIVHGTTMRRPRAGTLTRHLGPRRG